MRILFAGTELYPHVTVGGLADVMAALPLALRARGADLRLLLPGFPVLLQAAAPLAPVRQLADLMGGGGARLLLGRTPAGVPVYLLDQPAFFGSGPPYEDRADTPRRFAALSWIAARLAKEGDDGWRPDILHVHDWPVALAPAYLAFEPGPRPAALLTIHNLAYQGIFPKSLLPDLRLPLEHFTPADLEYYDQICFLKAGLVHADRISTVSPTYAREIQDPSKGGLHGLLAARGRDLVGILNGVDAGVWTPSGNLHLAFPYDLDRLDRRTLNKAALQRELGLREDPEALLFAIVSRFAPQKGLDLVLEVLPRLARLGAQLAVLGQGDGALETAFRAAPRRYPGRVASRIGYDTGLSHRCYGGADVILVPSREEPCGLTQLYAQAYGALPLVRRTGGLADTVLDPDDSQPGSPPATGFVFEEATAADLAGALDRACARYRSDPAAWRTMQRAAMGQDRGWDRPAQAYLDLYGEMAARRG